jgi:DNA-binding MarR family transcriptional regulator
MNASDSQDTAPNGLDEGVLAQLLGYRLALATVATHATFAQHVGEPMQLKTVEFTVLMLALANAELTQKNLATLLSLPAPNLTLLLDRLQQRGLIARVRSETDRRAQRIQLTTKGSALARRAKTAAATMEQDLLRRLSPAENAMLFELLRKVSAVR